MAVAQGPISGGALALKFFLLSTLADALAGLQLEGAIYQESVEAVARLL